VETYTIRDQGDVIVITKWAVLHTRQTRDALAIADGIMHFRAVGIDRSASID
jgi:hypothetical protein